MLKSDEFPYCRSMGYDENREKRFLMPLRTVTFTEENPNNCTKVEGYSNPLLFSHVQVPFLNYKNFLPEFCYILPTGVSVRCAILFWTKNSNILSSVSTRSQMLWKEWQIHQKCMVVVFLTSQQIVAQRLSDSEVASEVLHLMDIMGTIPHEIGFSLLNHCMLLILSFAW